MQNQWLYTCPEIIEYRTDASDVISKGDINLGIGFLSHLFKKGRKESKDHIKAVYLELSIDFALKFSKLAEEEELFSLEVKNKIVELSNSENKYEKAIGQKYKPEICGVDSLFKIIIKVVIRNIDVYEDSVNILPLDMINEYFNSYRIWIYKNRSLTM